MKASDLKVGDKAVIKELNVSNKEVRRHLLDMGVCRGTIIKIKNNRKIGCFQFYFSTVTAI